MNTNLNEAINNIGKADALMYAIETTYLGAEFLSDSKEQSERMINAFYALWDIIKNVSEDLDRLAEDDLVIDVIYAANKTRNRSLKAE